MAKFRGNFDKGYENEAALCQARMRNLHGGLVNRLCFVEENIEIDDPGAARDKLAAAKLAFHVLQCIEQLARRKGSFRLDNAIQKPWLREEIDRLRFVNRRAAQNSDANSR